MLFSARNYGFAQSTGEYIPRLDSDDKTLAENFMYDMQTQKALSNPAVWIANYFNELEETISAREVYVYHMKKVFGAMQAYIDGKRIKGNVKSLETITIK